MTDTTASGPRPTPRYSDVVKRASQLADELGHSHVGVEHLFVAILENEHSLPAQQLGKIADRDAIRQTLLETMRSEAYNA
ncbi:Clp protease N-terminal domain-containing protein [Amycolatopsis australiensis]|uniref:Clp protease N-terminal domain-containing protein n=1 Tax=Amycolatopsis australiensis TaxID=546364 RepID=UPI0009310552|nr:Clp protease N-terminal domain-containing protein [Amycolatopsis australiensis]